MSYTTVEKIATIRLKLHKVLPAVYDESLSYLEGLAKLTYKVNETIGAVNDLGDNVDLLNDSVTDLNNRVTSVEGEIDGFEAEITKRIAELEISLTKKIDTSVGEMEEKVDNKLAEVDTELSEMQTKIDEMQEYVSETVERLITEFNALVDGEIARLQELYESFEYEMRKYVEDTINELIQNIPDLTNIYVVDPSTGKLVKVQVAINNIFHFNLYNALTIDEYLSLNMNINECNSLMVNSIPRGLTIKEWLHDAKNLLIKILPVDKIGKWLHPHEVENGILTGVKDWLYKNVEVNTSMWAWSGTFTCNELVTLGKTIDEINALNITCEDWMLKANELVI